MIKMQFLKEFVLNSDFLPIHNNRFQVLEHDNVFSLCMVPCNRVHGWVQILVIQCTTNKWDGPGA